jgi:hypothetical protein
MSANYMAWKQVHSLQRGAESRATFHQSTDAEIAEN